MQSVDVELSHIKKDLEYEGEKDEDWIPKIAGQGWVLITGDRGRRPKSNTGEKLPIVCKACGITHAALSTAVNGFSRRKKLGAILLFLDDLIALKDSPPGSSYELGIVDGAICLLPAHVVARKRKNAKKSRRQPS